MVQTRSEVRIPVQHNDEDEIEIEDDNDVEDDEMEMVDKDETTGEETMNRVYNVIVYYGGYFVHVSFESYTSSVRKVYKHIDLENLSINDLKLCFGAFVGEFDSLYFKTSGLKIVLLNEESKPAVIKLSKECGYNIVLYMYHVTHVNGDSNTEMDDYACSDDEFVEIRKACREEKMKMNEYEIEANLGESEMNLKMGLDKAIRELLPYVEHRFCTRHLNANLKGKYPNSLLNDTFWKASTATHPQTFKSAMKQLARASKGALEKMDALDPAVWSKAYFKTHSLTVILHRTISVNASTRGF
ncbi:hypothetical protein POM88_029934 [Heracleum sosnowskyi]|uniref:Transposase n=1 Tax=Heracleum sosnowskyi TaxID=360622 RepID=A0AAD8MHM1_9APIA|nr:hypothetical protein POM88_029934 [Heracleum sosnowskyi]